jgi:hypothetical protein
MNNGTHSVGGWVGPTVDLDRFWEEEISYLYWESNRRSSKMKKPCARHKSMCGNMLALSPGTRRRCVFCCKLRPLSPGERVHNSLDQFGGPHSWSRCLAEEKNFLSLPEIPCRNIGTLLTEIFKFWITFLFLSECEIKHCLQSPIPSDTDKCLACEYTYSSSNDRAILNRKYNAQCAGGRRDSSWQSCMQVITGPAVWKTGYVPYHFFRRNQLPNSRPWLALLRSLSVKIRVLDQNSFSYHGDIVINAMQSTTRHKPPLIGAFLTLRKETISLSCFSVRPSVCPHGTTQLPLGEFCWNLILIFLNNLLRKYKFY